MEPKPAELTGGRFSFVSWIKRSWPMVMAVLLVAYAAYSVIGKPSQTELSEAAAHARVTVVTVQAGQGGFPKAGDTVVVNYVGKLAGGAEFDRGDKVDLPLDRMIPGFAQGLLQMQRGGRYHLKIPAVLAYGPQESRDPRTGKVVIPANSDLEFDIDMLDIKPGN